MRRWLLRLLLCLILLAAILAGTVQVKIRASDFSTYTRQARLRPPGNSTQALYEVACELLAGWQDEFPGRSIRLLGVGGAALAAAEQLDLFDAASDGGGNRLDQTVDRIRERFGTAAVSRARSMDRD